MEMANKQNPDIILSTIMIKIIWNLSKLLLQLILDEMLSYIPLRVRSWL